jgi:hypothetical protein
MYSGKMYEPLSFLLWTISTQEWNIRYISDSWELCVNINFHSCHFWTYIIPSPRCSSGYLEDFLLSFDQIKLLNITPWQYWIKTPLPSCPSMRSRWSFLWLMIENVTSIKQPPLSLPPFLWSTVRSVLFSLCMCRRTHVRTLWCLIRSLIKLNILLSILLSSQKVLGKEGSILARRSFLAMKLIPEVKTFPDIFPNFYHFLALYTEENQPGKPSILRTFHIPWKKVLRSFILGWRKWIIIAISVMSDNYFGSWFKYVVSSQRLLYWVR